MCYYVNIGFYPFAAHDVIPPLKKAWYLKWYCAFLLIFGSM